MSLDLPCHGLNRQADEPEGLAGWRYRIDRDQKNFIANLNTEISQVLNYLIEQGYTDSEKISACGTSRGGFIALHYAASDQRIKSVAAFAPVTDLAVLNEFKGTEQEPAVCNLALTKQAQNLAGRAVWLAIGDRDKRVGTDSAIAFARSVWHATKNNGNQAGLQLHILSEPQGHTTPAGAPKQAAEWILKNN